MKCFCGNEMTEIFINDAPFFSCGSCGYLRKKMLPDHASEKERYDQHVCDEGYIEYMRGVHSKIQPFLKGKCLDFGCGKIHALADILNSLGTLCDYYDLYYFPEIPPGKYDTIILIEVFEHIPDIYGLMEDLRGRLSPDGRVIIMTMKKRYPLEKWWYMRDLTHVSFVDSGTMEILARKTGFSVREEKGFFVFDIREA